MAGNYHKCYFCGGDILEKRITTHYRWGEDERPEIVVTKLLF